MSILQSIILALVEGLTEFLPVSSTGHMILTEGILGMENSDYLKAFTVMIQFGAILSVVVYYFRRFLPFPILGLKPDPTTSLGGWRLYLLMIVGCIPAAILGALFNDKIDLLLGSTWVVLTMLFLGGILMIYFDRIFTHHKDPAMSRVFEANWHTLLIGNVVAFVVALLAIKFFIDFVTKYGFRAFGYYRIILSVALAIAMLCGANISLQ